MLSEAAARVERKEGWPVRPNAQCYNLYYENGKNQVSKFRIPLHEFYFILHMNRKDSFNCGCMPFKREYNIRNINNVYNNNII